MRSKKTMEDEINEFLEVWDFDQQLSFLKDVLQLVELYNIDDDDDWVRDIVGDEDTPNVRLIRSVYLISKIAEMHSGKLCSTKVHFRGLHQRMEQNVNA